MTAFRQYLELVLIHLRMFRSFTLMISIVNIGFAIGLVLGFSYIIPDVSETTALYLVTGTATQMIVTVSLVGLPQVLSEMKRDGRMEYFFTLPISREAYVLSLISTVFVQSLPAMILAFAFGAWYYEISLAISPLLLVVIPLAVVALAGLGVTIAVLSPHAQLTNAFTQMVIFYALFFSPVILPNSQLPAALRAIGRFVPTSYVADAMRGASSDLPETHLMRSVLVLAAFAIGTVSVSAVTLRRRG